jgi:hypothetical protein
LLATTFGKITRTSRDGSPENSSARSRQAAQQRVETAYAHGPLMLASTTDASSMFHWRTDSNHEPLISLRGPRLCSSSSIKASATSGPTYTRSSRDTPLFLRLDRGRSSHDHHTCHRDSNDYRHSLYPLLSTRHSPALSSCKKPARNEANRHSPLSSWAQRFQLNLAAWSLWFSTLRSPWPSHTTQLSRHTQLS